MLEIENKANDLLADLKSHRLPMRFQDGLENLINQCLDADPLKRPTADVLHIILNIWKNEVENNEDTEFKMQAKEAEEFLTHGVYSTLKIQPYNSEACGQIVMYWLFALNNGKDFYDTVFELKNHFREST